MGTAESCTGGRIAACMTSVPGSSTCFCGGVVTYRTEEKTRVLGVPEELIHTHGVVSEAVAEAMCTGLCRLMDCDFAISITGYAGPSGGTALNPVGTAYVGIGTAERVVVHRIQSRLSSRTEIQDDLAGAALRLFYNYLCEMKHIAEH